jgi:hypothetical protein
LRQSLRQFYGAQEAAIRRSLSAPDAEALTQVRADLADILEAV